MKEFIFISDFDGTITQKDFYWILLDDYIGQKGIDYYHEWKKSKKIGTEFLNTVFTWYSFTEVEKNEALDKVSLDQALEKTVSFVEDRGGEFIILSAGFDYYIQKALDKRGLGYLKLLTNHGSFINNSFVMEPDESSAYHSDIYGIDKEKVAIHYRKQCKRLYFAGDSEPDYLAALQADVVFAKHELARLLELNNISYVPYDNFNDILSEMKKGI